MQKINKITWLIYAAEVRLPCINALKKLAVQ